jgi:hypothetical protein
MTHEKHPKPTKGDRLYETFVCGGVGGAAVVLFFLAVDVAANRPLFTPSLVGSTLFLGVDAASVDGVSLSAVSAATVGHLLTFSLVGFLASTGVRTIEEKSGGSFAVPSLALLLGLEAVSLVVFGVLRPDLGAEVGHGMIFAANLLSAVVMVAFLRLAHESSEAVSLAKLASGGAGPKP